MRWLKSINRRFLNWAAYGYRSLLRGPVFIGITGSVGKTTAKELLVAILRTRMRGKENVGSENTIGATRRLVLSVRPTDDFCLQEIGINPYTADASLEKSVAIFRPDVAVVTRIARDHSQFFPGEDAIAAEKSKLVRALSADGLAVLNHDDPRVLAMSGACAGRVRTFGRAPEAWLSADEISSIWPARLRMRLHCEGQTAILQTRFCGEFWVDSILAAIAAAVALGVPLDVAAGVVAAQEPSSGRMSAELHADGVTFIRNDWKATGSTMPAMLDFVRQARAARKIFVVGTVFDPLDELGRYYSTLAEEALGGADFVCFVGDTSHHARGIPAVAAGKAQAFPSVLALAEFFRGFLRRDDLVVVVGMHTQDHLERLVMDRQQAIACWKARCGRGLRCYECDLTLVPATVE
jgi:UDP-N-acetylmuramoyl-tripeptide--D-alanyl-D-alanine ligase